MSFQLKTLSGFKYRFRVQNVLRMFYYDNHEDAN